VTAADWAASSSAVIAVLALFVSMYALRAQRKSHDQDTEAQAADMREQTAERLSTAVHDLNRAFSITMGPPDQANSGPVMAAFAEAQQLVLRVVDLSEKLTAEGGEPDWFCWLTLAVVFTQLWDAARADDYWNAADQAAADPESHLIVLRAKANFHFNVGRPAVDGKMSDFDAGRACFKKALEIEPGALGSDFALEKNVATLTNWACLELTTAGNIPAMQVRSTKAWTTAEELSSEWRKKRSKTSIGDNLSSALLFADVGPDVLAALPAPLAQGTLNLINKKLAMQRQMMMQAQMGSAPPGQASPPAAGGGSVPGL
jgi:hypothetical protein